MAADVSLNFPDFRAGERTFQLLTQVAGRSGRGTIPGKVIIQTYNPSCSSIEQAIRQDFLSFYHQEISLREELGYPPFSRLVNVRIVGKDGGETGKCAVALGKGCCELQQKSQDYRNSLEILGPVEAPWEKLKGKYRWQLLLKGKNREDLHRFTHAVANSLAPKVKNPGVAVTVDIDPINLL